MSLISFHRLLIAIAIVFCGGYAIWEILRFLSDGRISSILLAAINQQPNDSSESHLDEETAKRLSSFIQQIAGMITEDGIPEAGIDRDSTGAVYGVGLLPVLRITLSDGSLFESTMTRMESEAGERMSVLASSGQGFAHNPHSTHLRTMPRAMSPSSLATPTRARTGSEHGAAGVR